MTDVNPSKAGPALNPTIQEVRGVFPSDAAMQEAISQLTLAGFDHAAFSLPQAQPAAAQATPEQGAATPLTDTDVRQARTMGTSMAGTVGAFAAAGIVVATGGAAAVAAAAAAAIGAGSALTASAVGNAADGAQSAGREQAAAAGQLVLSVQAPQAEQQAVAERIMNAAGAVKVQAIAREGAAVAGLDSAGWTG